MSESVQDRLKALIIAGYPGIALRTHEEKRGEALLVQLGKQLKRPVFIWSHTQGWVSEGAPLDLKTGTLPLKPEGEGKAVKKSPSDAMEELFENLRGKVALIVLKDLQAYLHDAWVLRKFQDVLQSGEAWTICLIAPAFQLPDQLSKSLHTLDLPLPTLEELRGILMVRLKQLAKAKGTRYDVPTDLIERVLKAALGLTAQQADLVFNLAVTNDQNFTESDLALIIREKKQVIQTSGVLQYFEADETLEGVGGQDYLKTWLALRKSAFSDKARSYGLPEPKGLFLLGVQGCGKSLVSKAIASYWRLPLLRLDIGALFSRFMGESESNLRLALRLAETISPTVLWIDEIEKGFSGVEGAGNSDAGTAARIFGTFLTWMQEKTKPVFVVATANSVEHLPAELLRKGRFDEFFFIDLPTESERKEILRIHLIRKKRDVARFDLDALAKASASFSGAEIEQALIDAMYQTFPQGREVETADLLTALAATVPLAETQRERVDALREWAENRARRSGPKGR